MRTIKAVLIVLLISQGVFAQSKKEIALHYIPQGTYSFVIDVNGGNTRKNISLAPFWVSNEITNKEYREYVEYVISHQEEHISVFDKEKAKAKYGEQWGEHLSEFITRIKFSEIITDIIDSSAWHGYLEDREMIELYSNYFIEPAFDNYPVVGVPYRHAEFFCIWKTNEINKIRKEKGQKKIHDFRLLQESEWKYVASQTEFDAEINSLKEIKLSNEKSYRNKVNLHPSDYGSQNTFEVIHIKDNVSEWVASSGKSPKVYGGSWKSATQEQILEEKSKLPTVGFRIARTYIPGERE